MARRTRTPGRAAATALVLASGLLAGCDTAAEERTAPEGTPTRGSTDRPSGSVLPTEPAPSPASALGGLPTSPPREDARALAGHLDRVVEVLADARSGPSDVRRAGEFEQLAARMLASAPPAYRREVLGRLSPAAAQKTRANVEAASLLDAMTTPQPELPDWRIVEPPPPDVLLGHYKAAGRQVGVPWRLLAAIHLVETRMGRIRGVSTAGALGPMQFLPTTWDLYGEGGDINDPRDAILAAARLLRANGAPGDLAGAVWHYNPSDNYVGAVLAYAGQLRRSEAAYRGYWHWRVLYKHERGTYVLDHGYPRTEPRLLG